MKQPLAHIHPDAQIADDVVIEPFATIQGNVIIESGCWIGANACIMDGARIGKNVKVYPGACIAAIPQDLKFKGEDSIAVIGDNTVIREYVTISRGTVDKMKTIIGKGCLLMAYVHVAHDCVVSDHCILSNSVQIAGHVKIDEYVVVGGTSAIHQFSRIGAHAMISGGSKVNKDVPPYATAGREPIAFCGINSIGLKRRGFLSDKIDEINEIYRYVYKKGFTRTQALESIKENLPSTKERDQIIDFILQSERGILRGIGS